MARPGHRQYISRYWDELRLARGISEADVVRITTERYREAMSLGIRRREVRCHRFDNPFMADHARRTMMSMWVRNSNRYKAQRKRYAA